MKFVDVILPLSIPQVFTYGVPLEWQGIVQVGQRVEVPFGARKIYSGLVQRIHNQKPEAYSVKPIRQILDQEPIVSEKQLAFWQWMAQYYACPIGDVMNAALPAHLKLVSETCVVLNPDANIDPSTLSDDEYLVWEALRMREEQSNQMT
jgi:primosomal protein N' (replication factor Y)